MHSSTPTKTLIIINSFAIGGPQKSLIGFLQRVNPGEHKVSVLPLQGMQSGPLIDYVPNHVTVLNSPAVYRAATLPKGEMVRSLFILLGAVSAPRLAIGAIKALLSVVRREPRTQLRQRFWRAIERDLPRVPDQFDSAVGILGQSTYAVIDLVTAGHRYHWIRSDSRILGRHHGIESLYFTKLAGAVAVSPTCADIFQKMYPSTQDRVRIYKNDIPSRMAPSNGPDDSDDSDENTFSPGPQRLLTIGRLDNLKGIDLAIGACKALIERGHDLEWDVLGDGEHRPHFDQLIADLGLGGIFHLHGNVLDTSRYMMRATIYVHPSRVEGRSNAVEEARSSGKPIVACDYPTVRDQVENDVTGLISKHDPRALADSIDRLLKDPALRGQLGTAAATEYEAEQDDPNFLLEAMAKGTL